MKTNQRPILTLKSKSLIDVESDGPLELAVYDVLLPCRQFAVSHKVAEVGRVSVTSEFLLRLLKTVDGMKEEDIAAFFGYDQREMSFVMSEVEANDFVVRKDGRVHLTTVGQGLFRDGSEYPEIYEVDSRREMVGFDLIALAPEDRGFLGEFERRLPELRARDGEKVSAAARLIYREAFRRFYGEIARRRDPTATAKRSLYSIDDVEAKDRFSSTVRFTVRSTGLRPSVAEPDMSGWRPEYEREDRADIIEAVSRFVDEMKMHRGPEVDGAYQILLALAPDFLKDFMRKDGFAVERYYREAFSRAGDVRSDRPTVPLLGSIFTRENTRRLFDVSEYGLKSVEKPPTLCVWVVPQTKHWGATTALPSLLEQFKSRVLSISDGETEDVVSRAVGMVAGHAPPKHIEAAFDAVGTSNLSRVSPFLELLLVPNVLIAVTVNAPIGVTSGLPVPLGFVSFDAEIVARGQRFLLNYIDDYALAGDINQQIRSACTAGPIDLKKE